MEHLDKKIYRRAQLYIQQHGKSINRRLGFGLDGSVYETNVHTAVKAFVRETSYWIERNAYLRLDKRKISNIYGHMVPQLILYDDALQIIEMSIVTPPYILDFAKAQFDFPPDFPDHVMEERHAHWSDMFGEYWPQVLSIMRYLEKQCGIYMLDPSPRNIAFAGPC